MAFSVKGFECGGICKIVKLRKIFTDVCQKQNKLPRDVPPGHLPVMVGEAGKRIVIRADHLNHPVLRQLLDQAYEENGRNNDGLLAIPCDEPSFREIIHSLTVGTKISSSSFTAHRRNPRVEIAERFKASAS